MTFDREYYPLDLAAKILECDRAGIVYLAANEKLKVYLLTNEQAFIVNSTRIDDEHPRAPLGFYTIEEIRSFKRPEYFIEHIELPKLAEVNAKYFKKLNLGKCRAFVILRL
ncbi:MAG: hypothetical protein ABL903_19260 [Methylococcales bacterium]